MLLKSQKPDDKKKKEMTQQNFIKDYARKTGQIIKPTAIAKKISNIKQRIKLKTDSNGTGNVPLKNYQNVRIY